MEVCDIFYGEPEGLGCQTGIPKGHSTHRSGNVSMYVIPEASSCMTQLVHIVATVGLSITSGCMCSRGTLEMVTGDGPPCRQAITSSKLGGGATTYIGPRNSCEGESHSTCSACNCSSAIWHWALLASELRWQYLCFDSPKAGEVGPAVASSSEGHSTLSQPRNWFGGTSTFANSSCSTWAWLVLQGDPNGS